MYSKILTITTLNKKKRKKNNKKTITTLNSSNGDCSIRVLAYWHILLGMFY